MKPLKAIRPSDVVPVGEFKDHAVSWLEKARASGHPIVITQNGKTAGIPRSEYEKIQYEQAITASIDQGLKELDAGHGVSTDELEGRLKRRIASGTRKRK